MDFFVVPTVRFQLLYVWFAIDHGRRQILHCNVTANPAARWVIQQLRNAFPDEPAHRFLIFDNDSIFSADVARSITAGWNRSQANCVPEPLAERHRGAFRGHGSPRATRSRRGVERGPPATAAP